MLIPASLLQIYSLVALLLPPPADPEILDPVIQSVEIASPDGDSGIAQLPPPSGCVPAPAGLISWWRGQNNTVDDWDSNDGPGLSTSPGVINPVTFTAGKVGNAFAGSFVVEDSPSLRLSNAFTIEAWVYVTTAIDPTNRAIVSKWGAPSDVSYLLGCSNRILYLQVSPSGTVADSVIVKAGQQLPIPAWIHVAGTYDGATLRIYTNGVSAGSVSYSLGVHQGFANVGIGRVPTNASLTTTTISNGYWNWRGYLDEVAIYDRALSAAELQGIVGAGGSGKCLSPPIFLTQPASQAVPLAEDVMFSAQIRGGKPMTYRWTSNGVTLTPAAFNSPRLLIEKLRTNNAGNYSLFVSNSLGFSNSSVATLSLLPTNVCFQPPLGITNWWPGDGSGTNLVGFSQVVSSYREGGAFPFVTGKIARGFAAVGSALTRPPIIPTTETWAVPSGPTINFGANSNFSIEAWIKTPVRISDFSWLSESPPLPAYQSILQKLATNGNLGSGYSLYLDRGRLTCALGGISNSSRQIFSSPGPDLRDEMFHHIGLTVARNSEIGGTLYVDGTAVLTFDTRSIMGAISNTTPLTLLVNDLFFKSQYSSVSILDELSFYGRALDADEIRGIAAAGAAGKCKTKPIIKTQPANQTVPLGADATFGVVPNSTGFLRYAWRQNGIPLAGATNGSIIVSNVTAANSGAYSVRLQNIFGETISSNAVLNLLPVAVCSNVTIAADPATCTANASIDLGSFDPEGHPITATQVPPGPYPLGTTPVTLVVMDNLGASNSCVGSVTVLDQTPPQITCPTLSVQANDPGHCGAVVNYPMPQASDSCSPITNLVCVPPSGSFFPVGSTTVNCAATDAGGNSAQCSFVVTVVDSEKPVISCPADLVITNAHDAWISVATFQISVSDNCPGTGSAVATPASGSALPLGTNPVSCVVTDAAGNVATCSFNVIVQPGNQAPVPVIKVSPLAHFAGWTNRIIIAPRGVEACVRLSGRRSFDPEEDVFSYAWWEGTNFFSTNMTTRVRLGVGSHDITLLLDDHLPLGTNHETVTLEIITLADAVAILIGQLEEAGLAANRLKPLLASLNAAYAAFRRGNFNAGANQLRAFEKKMLNHDAPDSAIAEALIDSAETILRATESDDESDCREHDSDQGHDGDDRDDDNGH